MDHQPLLGDDGFFDEGLVQQDPIDPEYASDNFENNSDSNAASAEEENDEGYDDETYQPKPCIQKLGFGIGLMLGITIQLSTLAGDYINVIAWGSDDGVGATTTFILWCCFMCSMFFLVFGILRFLVQMSFQMVYKMEEEITIGEPIADVPSDSPMPGMFPAIRRRLDPLLIPTNQNYGRVNGARRGPSRAHEELLDDVMFHLKCHYGLGINFGISLSWAATNVLLGGYRVSLMFCLVPIFLGLFCFWWVRRDHAYRNTKLNETIDDERGLEEVPVL